MSILLDADISELPSYGHELEGRRSDVRGGASHVIVIRGQDRNICRGIRWAMVIGAHVLEVGKGRGCTER